MLMKIVIFFCIAGAAEKNFHQNFKRSQKAEHVEEIKHLIGSEATTETRRFRGTQDDGPSVSRQYRKRLQPLVRGLLLLLLPVLLVTLFFVKVTVIA